MNTPAAVRTIADVALWAGALTGLAAWAGDRARIALTRRAGALWHQAHGTVWLAAVHDDPGYRDRKAREAARMMALAELYGRIATLLGWRWNRAATHQVTQGHRELGAGRPGGDQKGR